MMWCRQIRTHFSLRDPFHLHIFDISSPHQFLLLLSQDLLFVFFCYMNSILSKIHITLQGFSRISCSIRFW